MKDKKTYLSTRDSEYLISTLQPHPSSKRTTRSFTHPDYDKIYVNNTENKKDWILLRSLHREKQRLKLQEKRQKREEVSV